MDTDGTTPFDWNGGGRQTNFPIGADGEVYFGDA